MWWNFLNRDQVFNLSTEIQKYRNTEIFNSFPEPVITLPTPVLGDVWILVIWFILQWSVLEQ